MPGNVPGESIETLFVELALKTERIEKDTEAALSKMEAQLKEKLHKPVDDANKKFIGLGEVGKASLQSIITSLVSTHNPLQAAVQGILTFNAGVQASAANGNQWAQSISGLTGKFAAWATALTVVVAGLGKVIQFLEMTAKQGLDAAARADSLTIGLATVAKNAGQNIDFVRQKIAQLQSQGIATGEAMETLMQFLTQKLPIENIEQLARAAQDMAVAFGRNSTETFQRFVYAITTGQTEVLRLVGVQKTATQMQEEYAQSLGKTREALTENERRLALINGILKQATGYTGLYENSLQAVGKQLGSLTRYISEGALALGQTLLPIMSLSVQGATLFWKEFQKMFVVVEKGAVVLKSDGTPQFTALGQAILNVSNAIKDTFLPMVKAAVEWMGTMAQRGTEIAAGFEPVMDAIKEFSGVVGGLLDFLDELWKMQHGGQSFAETMSAGFTALGQVVTLIAAMLMGFFQVVADGFENMNRLMKGESLRSIDEINQRADQAFKSAMLRFSGIQMEANRTYDTIEDIRTRRGAGAGAQPYPEEPGKEGPKFDYDKLGVQIADAIEQGRKAVDKAAERFNEQMRKFNEQVTEAMQRLSESLAKAEDKAREGHAKAVVKLEEEYAKQLEKLEKQKNEVLTQEEDRFHEQQTKEQADFLFELQRMEEDYTNDLTDAVQARDAKQVLQLMRQHDITKRRMFEDFERGGKAREEDHKKRLASIDQQEQDVRQRMAEALEERKADMRKALEEQLAEMEENYREQMRELIDSTSKQRTEMRAGMDKQLEDMKSTNRERIAEMVAHWADMEGINAEGAQKVLDAIDSIYGEDGSISVLLEDFLERMKRNEQITITIKEGPQEAPTAGSNRGRPGGGRQFGGFETASQATTVTYGEAGPEAALFMPMNGQWSLAQFAAMLGRGGGAGGRADQLDVNVNVTADGNFSPMFEDRLLGVIAEIIPQALPGARVNG